MNMKKVGCVYPNKKKSFRGAWRAQPPKRVAALPICASPAASNPTQRFIPISKVARCWQSDRAFRVGKHTESLHSNKQRMNIPAVQHKPAYTSPIYREHDDPLCTYVNVCHLICNLFLMSPTQSNSSILKYGQGYRK